MLHQTGTVVSIISSPETANRTGTDTDSRNSGDEVWGRQGIPAQDKIYAFRGEPSLYVGFPDQIRPTIELVERWEKDIVPRFWTDALEFQNKIMKTKAGRHHRLGMSLELRMSGYASPHRTDVELVPRI